MANENKYQFLLKSFGLQGLKVVLYKAALPKTGLESKKSDDYTIENINEDIPVEFCDFGTPIFDNLILDIEGEKLRIDSVLIDCTGTKNIVKSAITGADYTVKEFISDGDYDINIKGLIVSENKTYPQDAVKQLIRICKKKTNIRVQSKLLNEIFEIDDIVIESYSLKQDEYLNMQAFELKCISDKPIELILSTEL